MIKPYHETELGKLYHGNCLEIMPLIGEKIDLILTDPPYGTTACKWDSIIPLDLMWKELKRIIKDNGAIVLFGSEPFSSYLRMSNIENYKYDVIWNKMTGSNFYESTKRPMKSHEIISIFYKKQSLYNPQMNKSLEINMRDRQKNYCKRYDGGVYGDRKEYIPSKNESERYPLSVLDYNSHGDELHVTKRIHPTQKSVKLIEYLIKTYTNENETVLDFTIGSGTTAVACERLNRRWIGIEISKEYCDIAIERIKKETVQLKLAL